MEFHSGGKKKSVMDFSGKLMELQNSTLSEVPKAQKDVCCMHL